MRKLKTEKLNIVDIANRQQPSFKIFGVRSVLGCFTEPCNHRSEGVTPKIPLQGHLSFRVAGTVSNGLTESMLVSLGQEESEIDCSEEKILEETQK